MKDICQEWSKMPGVLGRLLELGFEQLSDTSRPVIRRERVFRLPGTTTRLVVVEYDRSEPEIASGRLHVGDIPGGNYAYLDLDEVIGAAEEARVGADFRKEFRL